MMSLSRSERHRLETKGANWWVNHEAEPNGIGPVCLYCDRLIDWAPRDHADSCPVPVTEASDEYEAVDLIAKVRPDGQRWFDLIIDLISADCESTEDQPCICGLESMGGTTGTLDQCYRHQGIADDIVQVNKADALLVLSQLATSGYETALPGLEEAIVRLHEQCTWWDDFLADLPDDDSEEP